MLVNYLLEQRLRGVCKVGFFLLFSFLWLLSGCSSEGQRQPVIAEAYVGPARLRLRKELGPRSPEAAELKHGERLYIVGRRRRFVKVRTSGGAEGWTEMRQLLSPSQMEALDKLARRAARLPSHGAATVYEALNVHTEPNRQAPSFHQIREGERVEVIEQRLAPRVPFQNPGILPRSTAPQSQAARKPRREPKYPPPPRPPAPAPPPNWLELSRTPIEPAAKEPEPDPPKPVPVDTWALVRLSSGRAGWVLARMLRMDIPDEVAQYSEGDRITSYFSVGQVNDGGVIKHNWLWTTIAPGNYEYDFDSFRYFIWNTRKHRYETAYVERNLKGYFPVTVHTVEASAGSKTQVMPGFSLVVEEKDGVRYRRTYAYQVYLVRLVGKTKWEPAAAPPEESNGTVQPRPAAPPPEQPSLLARLKRNFRRVLGR